MGSCPVVDALCGADCLRHLAFFSPDTQWRECLRKLFKLLCLKTFCADGIALLLYQQEKKEEKLLRIVGYSEKSLTFASAIGLR